MRKFGLIGFPLEHSFSPQFFAEKFAREAIDDAVYDLYPLQEIGQFTALIREIKFSGLNVTIPYKEKIIPFLDLLSAEAQKIGAVNCIQFENDLLIGHNTDAEGFRRSIKPFLENKFERAMIIGTGGSSKTVAHVLSEWSLPFVFVSRHPEGDQQIHPDQITEELIQHYPLIINTSPAGMFPNIHDAPAFPFHYLNARHFYFDLVYNPDTTLAMKLAGQRGCMTMNGYHMLVIQALESWRIWNGPAMV